MLATKRLRSLAIRVQRRVERTVFPLGRSVECPFCGWTGWRFLSAGLYNRPNRLCPGCGSLERYRMLPLVLERRFAGRTDLRLLELAPKPCFTAYCRRQGWRYLSSDLMSPHAMVRGDLRSMPFATGSFDVIVCFHVMEHIHEDLPAFAEIARLLDRGGVAILCVPLRGPVTQEGAPESEWERRYGQADHVRYYGMDIEDRMRASGLAVERLDTLDYFDRAQLDRHALRGDDRYLFLATRAEAA
jgi:SAM-dependent methyltransferase